MGKCVAITKETNVPRFVRQLTDEIDANWAFNANAYRVNENEWKIIAKNRNAHSYAVKITTQNNVLTLNVGESGVSMAKTALTAIGFLALGAAVGTRTNVGRGILGGGLGQSLSGERALKKLEKMVDNFTTEYFRC